MSRRFRQRRQGLKTDAEISTIKIKASIKLIETLAVISEGSQKGRPVQPRGESLEVQFDPGVDVSELLQTTHCHIMFERNH